VVEAFALLCNGTMLNAKHVHQTVDNALHDLCMKGEMEREKTNKQKTNKQQQQQ